VQLVTSTANFTQSVPAALAQTAWLWETNEGRGSRLDSIQAKP